MQPRLFILADDLTGGLDTGVALAARGWRTVLRFASDQRGPAAHSCPTPHPSTLTADVMVWDTETRHADEEEARRIVREVCQHPSVQAAPRLYKKIDSTLRGPWLAELHEVWKARAPLITLLCPAFPAVGRTVVAGEVRVHGERLSEAGFDGTGRLKELLLDRWPGRIKFAHAISDLGPARSPDPKSKRRVPTKWVMGTRNPQSNALLLADAETDSDLDALALHLHQLNRDELLCGAGGLAAAWARILIPEPRPLSPPDPVTGPIWVLAGSQHSATRAQMEALAAGRGCHVERLEAHSSDFTQRLRSLPQHPAIALALTASPPHRITPSFAAWAADCITAIAAEARERGVAAFVATGGETAALLLRALGTGALEIDRELLPGIPLCRIAGGPWTGTPLVTKAGGFGSPDALAQTLAVMRAGGAVDRR